MTTLFPVFLSTLFIAIAMPLQKCKHASAANSGTSFLVSKVSYHSTGGRGGNYESLEISADSAIYMQARRGEEKTVRQQQSPSSWTELLSTINLADFDKIKSNPGHALYDGIDVTLSVDTQAGKHSVVNGNEDSVNYGKIKPLTDLLEKQLSEMRQQILR